MDLNNYEELEREVFDLLEKRGSFLQAEIVINRLNYDNWLIETPALEKGYVVGTGKTKLEAMRNLYNKLKED